MSLREIGYFDETLTCNHVDDNRKHRAVMYRPNKLDVDRAFVLVIDVQEKLLGLIDDHQRVLRESSRLVAGADIFSLPVLVTEQYPKGLGHTEDRLRRRLAAGDATFHEKPTFSAWDHEPVRQAITAINKPQVLVAGIETHICVLQTSMDLAAVDYEVFVCADATGSRRSMDFDMALPRMREAGVQVVTTESALFELCHRCDTDTFKAMLKIIKE
ncbi:MAG: hydrolase [Planctomycetota bacterium]